MAVRRSSIILGSLGVISIGGAVALHFVAGAQFERLPGNLDITAKSTGTGTLLDPAAIQAGDFAHVYLTNVPISTVQHEYVSRTVGSVAILESDLTITAPHGVTMTSNHTYAIDRKTLDAVDPPAGTTVEKHDGVVLGLPPNASTDTAYQLYDSVTTKAFPMKFAGIETVSGREVSKYDITAVGKVGDPALLKTLPPMLPGGAIAALAATQSVAAHTGPADQAPAPTDVAALQAPVPVEYAENSTYTFRFDKKTGTPISVTTDQTITGGAAGGNSPSATFPVLSVKTATTPDSIHDAAHAASTISTVKLLLTIIVPLILILVGLVFLAIGFVRRQPALA